MCGASAKFSSPKQNMIDDENSDLLDCQRPMKRPRKNGKRRTKALNDDLLDSPPFIPKDWDSFYQLAQASVTTKYKDCQELPRLLPAMTAIHQLIGNKKMKDT